MSSRILPLVLLAVLASSTACVVGGRFDAVNISALRPRYVRPAPSARSTRPIAVVYAPGELPDVLPLSVPSSLPAANLLEARSLVTLHLRTGLESLFEQVLVTGDAAQVPPGALLCTVHVVEVGLVTSAGGNMLVGTLEWSVAITAPGSPQVLYSWGDRTVGTREGAGSFGQLDPAPLVQGAIEASLRTMLKDMHAKGVATLAAP